MKKNLHLLLSLLVLTFLLVLPFLVFAQTPPTTPPPSSPSNSAIDTLTKVATNGGYQPASTPQGLLPTVIGVAIQAALSLLGAVFVILIIVGGYVWMTAEGNDQKVEKAQNYIRRAIIGMLITFSAWAIWSFILSKFILTSK